ncbi:MAG: AAA family ATPase [Acidobacteria bacterium]|jgi:hypothetical protein|nr:AAA family ATPase [Acidobacteriota bacterium]
MSGPALSRVLSALSAHGHEARKNGSGFMARCPAHDDSTPSLSVSNGGGKCLVCCHAGCSTADIVAALGLSERDLFDESSAQSAHMIEVASYTYRDESNVPLFQVVRYAPKDFRQRQPDGTPNVKGVRKVLYNLPAVLAVAADGGTVLVVEGEKDADRFNHDADLADGSIVATCNAGGAGKWRDDYSPSLKGAHVVVVADRDEPGRKHAADVLRSVRPYAASVRVVEAAQGKDLSDHLDAGLGLGQLVNTTDATEKGAAASEPEPYPTLTIDWILDADIPAPTYLLPGIEEGDTFGLFGPTGSSKTLWTLAVGLALAAGRPILGKYEISRRYRVLMLSEEDSTARTMRRVRRLCACMGIDRQDIQDTFHVLSKSGFLATNPTALDRLRRTLDHLKAEVTFIDSINQTSGIKALKDAEAVREYYRDRIDPLRAVPSLRLICTVGHTNKSVWNRVQLTDPEALVFGSQDFLAATDASLLIRKHQKEPNVRVVECLKVRDGEKPNPVEIEIFNDRIASPDKTTCPFALLYRRDLQPDEASEAVRRATKEDAVVDFLRGRAPARFTRKQITEAISVSEDTINRAARNYPEIKTITPAGKPGLLWWEL